VAGDQSQRPRLAAAADHQRGAGLLRRRRHDLEVIDPVVLAGERKLLVTPETRENRQRLLELGVALGRRRERQVEGGELRRQPADAEAEHQATVREVVEVRRVPRQGGRVAVADAVDDRTEPDLLRHRREGGQAQPGVGLEGGVVEEEETVEAELLDQPRPFAQRLHPRVAQHELDPPADPVVRLGHPRMPRHVSP
jgi:hypothetical protein